MSAALAFNDAPKFDYDRTFWTSCDNPAGAGLADDVRCRRAGAVVEDLGELGVARHLHDRTDLDALLVHRDEQVGDATMLGLGVGVGLDGLDLVGVEQLHQGHATDGGQAGQWNHGITMTSQHHGVDVYC